MMNPGRTFPYIPNIMPFERSFPPSPQRVSGEACTSHGARWACVHPSWQLALASRMLSGSRSTWHPYVCRGSWSWTLQWVFPKVTFQTQPQRVGLRAWTCGRNRKGRFCGFPQGSESSLLSAGHGYMCSVLASWKCLSQSYSQVGVLGGHLCTGLGCAGDGPQGQENS